MEMQEIKIWRQTDLEDKDEKKNGKKEEQCKCSKKKKIDSMK